MLEIKQNSIKILDRIIDEKGCPFLDYSIYGEECHPDCICKLFDNSNLSCYEIAKKIKNSLNTKKC